MNRPLTAAVAILSLRIAYGAGLLAAPQSLTRRWLGPGSASAATQVSVRALGAREIAVHTGALHAALSGAALRPWLAASIAGDLADIAATVAASSQLPDGSAAATLAVGGGSALLTFLLAATAER